MFVMKLCSAAVVAGATAVGTWHFAGHGQADAGHRDAAARHGRTHQVARADSDGAAQGPGYAAAPGEYAQGYPQGYAGSAAPDCAPALPRHGPVQASAPVICEPERPVVYQPAPVFYRPLAVGQQGPRREIVPAGPGSRW